jgi:hypothetical protein
MCLRSSLLASAGSARWLVRVKHPVASVPVGSRGRTLICSREQPLSAQRSPVRDGGAFKAVAVARVWLRPCSSLALRTRSAGPQVGSGAGSARAAGTGALRSPAVKWHGAPGLEAKASATLWANRSFERQPSADAQLKR